MLNDIKIFLSSTQDDLYLARQNIIKFLGVLQSDLVAMEVFGSDESKPKDYCLEQVRKCNFFVGVYAERYGTVDKETGKSITELEYREAMSMLQNGRLKGLLLYVINPKANWPLDLIEREPTKVTKLSDFKQEISYSHTITFFNSTDDLPLFVLRDVIRKIGIGTERMFRAKDKKNIKKRNVLERPVGMEYYSEELSDLFFGRESEINALEQQVIKYKMSLLIGSSGVGKTSLLYAGLAKRATLMGWQIAILRPLNNPIYNLKRFLWEQLLDGPFSEELDLVSVVNAALAAHNDRHILIVIDQFEDILLTKASEDIQILIASLVSIFNSNHENLRILISYRGDVESQVGNIWQKISGAPNGLPRYYLGPLKKEAARVTLRETLKALKIILKNDEPSTDNKFVDKVIADLESESLLSGHSGIYPPFLQMVIAKIYEDTNKKRQYLTSHYSTAGQCKKIIADYLIHQLNYLGKNVDIGKKVLIALVSSYGTKTQKSFGEIIKESLIEESKAEIVLRALIDLRMIRLVNNSYEIAHDFLAKLIASELVSTEEREAKKFKDLLSSKAAAFETTHAGLTRAEHLHIYKYRDRILCTEDEIRLLFDSYLSGNGPIHYWINSYPKFKVINWAKQSLPQASVDILKNSYKFLIKMGESIPLDELAKVFSDYTDKDVLSTCISKFSSREHIDLLLKLHRKKAEEIRSASERALIKLITLNDENLLEDLAKSKSESSKFIFELLSLNLCHDVPVKQIRTLMLDDIAWKKLFAMYAIGVRGQKNDIGKLQDLMHTRLPNKNRIAVIKSIVRIASRIGKASIVKDMLTNKDPVVVENSLKAIERPLKGLNIKDILPLYDKYSFLISQTIYNIATEKDLSLLRKLIKKLPLIPPSRESVYALCKFGGRDDYTFLFNLFMSYKEKIDFWNAFALIKEISKMADRKHFQMLEKIIKSKEFWEYYPFYERPKEKIPVNCFENLYFIKRLTGITFGKIANRNDFSSIRKMLQHDYWVIQNSAIEAANKFCDASDLQLLVEDAIQKVEKSDGNIKAICNLDEKIYGNE